MRRDFASTGGDAGAALLAFGSGYDTTRGSGPVRRLQRLLARAGARPGPIDGRYGPLTERAVMRVQIDHGLQVDGIAGPQTLAALSSPNSVLYPGAGYGDPTGSEPVRAMQRLLAHAGDRPGPLDGLYGPLTERAVERYQAGHGLEVDGIAGRRTLALLLGQHDPYGSDREPTGLRAPRANRRSVRSARATRIRHTSQPTGWPAIALLGLLVGLGLVTVLAAAWWNRRQSQDEPDPNVAFSQGLALEGQGDVNGAKAAYRRADQRGHAAAACNLGALLEGQGDLSGARAAYRRADRRGDGDGAFNLGVLLEGQGDLDGARAAFRHADERGHAAAASNLGLMLEQQGDVAGAQAAYRRADQRGDDYGAFNLGCLLAERSELVAAEEAYRRAEKRGDAKVANLARSALAALEAALVGSSDSEGDSPDAR